MVSVATEPAMPPAERRYMTILFVDLIGYTALSQRLDPEDLRSVQSRYQALALRSMEPFGGFVGRFVGDGILVYFGYPTAHEKDAERAVRAALEFIERLRHLDIRLQDADIPQLQVRIGIHTGLVLVASETLSGGLVERGIVGEAVNIAARLQAEAPHNGIIVSRDTLDLLGGQFEFAALGERPIKGLARPLALFQVLRSRPGAPRPVARDPAGTAPMIGREDALARLLAGWGAVRGERRCRTIAVSGEAGVGKTRLVREFCRQPGLAGAAIVQAPCDEIFASTPLYPVASLLWARTGLAIDDDDATRTGRISAFLDTLRLNDAENRELVASLLGLARTGVVEATAPTPLLFKRRQYDFVRACLRRIAGAQPTVLWVEDAHWLDPSSSELLGEIVADLADLPLLVLLTVRSFPKAPWLPEAEETIALEALARQHCLDVVRSMAGAERLSSDTVARAVAAADGVPLFLEQFVIALLEEIGTPAASHRSPAVPLRLAEMMSERLDRRPGGRRIVQTAACIGRPFPPDFLATLLDQDTATVAQSLHSLVEAEILLVRRHGAETRFEFRHALLQRMARESITLADRRATHDRIVALLSVPDTIAPVQPEVLAHHLTEAGRFGEAIRAWLGAALGAAQMSAHVEAIGHVRRGLDLLEKLPDAADRRHFELHLQAARMGSIIATEGSTSAGVSECCRRGLELCREGPASPLALAFAFGQFTFTNCIGQVEEAASMAGLFLSLSERAGNESGRVVGHRMVGTVRLGQGRLEAAREQLEASLRLYVPERDAATTHMFGQSTEVHTKSSLSLVLLCMGEVDQALDLGMDALRSADALRHPLSSAIPLAYVGGWVFGLCGAVAPMKRECDRLIALADQHRLGSFRALGNVLLGWALSQQGDPAAGAAVMEAAIAALEGLRFRLAISGYLGNWADALRQLGEFDRARAACARAFDSLAESSCQWFEPELRRIEALIALDEAPAGRDVAERRLREAVEAARSLRLPTMEHRCLVSLRRCLGAGRADPAVQVRLRELSHLGDLTARVVARYGRTA